MFITWMFLFLLLVVVIGWPKAKDDAESIQEEYNRELKENLKENQMTEHPVSHAEVVAFTRSQLADKYGNHILFLIR